MTALMPRQYSRYPVNLKVDYTTRDAFLANQVTNLSRAGLFIESEAPLPVSSELDVFLTLPDRDERIRARGRVIWNYDIPKGTSRVVPGMGIKFLDLSPADSQTIAHYLASLAPAPSKPPAAAG